MSDEHHARRAQVRAGYDHMAEHYLASKAPLADDQERLLTMLLTGCADDVPVLELGCGAGVPVTQWLAERRTVVGIDLSMRQLELARRHVPNAHLIQADMTGVDFPDESFGAVVALYAIIHVPREEHAPLLSRIVRWLQPGGRFLATWPLGAWEGEEQDWSGWGASMWWSHFGRDQYLALLESAGFAIELAQERYDGESWCWVLARKLP